MKERVIKRAKITNKFNLAELLTLTLLKVNSLRILNKREPKISKRRIPNNKI